MLKAVLVDLEEKRIRNIQWSGDYERDELEDLIRLQDRDTEFQRLAIGGVEVTVFYACGAIDGGLCGWRLKGQKWPIFFSSAICLPIEDAAAPFSNIFNTDCPLTAWDVGSAIEWFEANEDFSVIVELEIDQKTIENRGM